MIKIHSAKKRQTRANLKKKAHVAQQQAKISLKDDGELSAHTDWVQSNKRKRSHAKKWL